MRRPLLALISLLVPCSVFAADLPVKKAPPVAVVPMYNWSGFYIGGFAGYGWGNTDWTRIQGSGGEEGNGRVRSFDLDGGLFGGQIGLNYQVQQWVFGVEGELGWSGVNGGLSGANNNGPASWNTDSNWLATLTGRVGYAFNNVLFYGKGGVAWSDNDYTHPATGGAGQALYYTASETRTGWLLGVGIEYGFAPNWSAKVEYNYIDFGSDNVTFNDATGRWVTFGIDRTQNVIKAGLNYRFGGGY